VMPVAFVCPSCHGALTATESAYQCASCRLAFPVVCGIPDFRLFPDPWIGMQEDRDKGCRLEESTRTLSFADTVRAYWQMTPSTSPQMANRFIDHVLTAATRSREWLDRRVLCEPAPGGPWLDLGCGTSDLGEAAPVHQPVIGIDIAFRWLVVARRRLAEAGRPAFLVCCNAEYLPFPPAAFSRVLSMGLLEHCADPRGVLVEAARVLAPGGQLALRTVNRFSLMPEPHVGLWGIGFLPRRWTARYVRWRSGQKYLHRPVSAAEIDCAASAAGLSRVRVSPAVLLREERERLGGLAVLAGLYERMAEMPVAGHGLRWVSPLLDMFARAR
jgi:ubiquinone/menaquinone biosynthesis C-methylase UbiE/uncharacterized protein YbaR (Trm112 family)